MSAYVSYTSFPVADLGEEPGEPGAPLFWMKKEEMTEGRKAGRANKTTPPPPPPWFKVCIRHCFLPS